MTSMVAGQSIPGRPIGLAIRDGLEERTAEAERRAAEKRLLFESYPSDSAKYESEAADAALVRAQRNLLAFDRQTAKAEGRET